MLQRRRYKGAVLWDFDGTLSVPIYVGDSEVKQMEITHLALTKLTFAVLNQNNIFIGNGSQRTLMQYSPHQMTQQLCDEMWHTLDLHFGASRTVLTKADSDAMLANVKEKDTAITTSNSSKRILLQHVTDLPGCSHLKPAQICLVDNEKEYAADLKDYLFVHADPLKREDVAEEKYGMSYPPASRYLAKTLLAMIPSVTTIIYEIQDQAEDPETASTLIELIYRESADPTLLTQYDQLVARLQTDAAAYQAKYPRRSNAFLRVFDHGSHHGQLEKILSEIRFDLNIEERLIALVGALVDNFFVGKTPEKLTKEMQDPHKHYFHRLIGETLIAVLPLVAGQAEINPWLKRVHAVMRPSAFSQLEHEESKRSPKES